MNWTKNKLRGIKIFNEHDLMKRTGAKLIIAYNTQDLGRVYRPMEWVILGNGFDTNPDAAWYDYNRQKFLIDGREKKQAALEKAMTWCKEKYGIEEFEKAPFNSYLPKGSMKKLASFTGKEVE